MAKRTKKPTRVVDIRTLPSPDSYESLVAVWEDLDRYRMSPRQHGYPNNVVHLFAPIDAVHEAMVAMCTQAQDSLVGAYYGWDDSEINDLFYTKLHDENVYVQLSLDSGQAGGRGEVPLLKKWNNGEIGNSIGIGHSPFSAISHDKMLQIDGVVTVAGSTNLSGGGQNKQNNEMVIVWDAVFAAEARAVMDRIHDEMLQQMAQHKQKLLVDYASKKSALTSDQKKALLAGDVSQLPED